MVWFDGVMSIAALSAECSRSMRHVNASTYMYVFLSNKGWKAFFKELEKKDGQTNKTRLFFDGKAASMMKGDHLHKIVSRQPDGIEWLIKLLDKCLKEPNGAELFKTFKTPLETHGVRFVIENVFFWYEV